MRQIGNIRKAVRLAWQASPDGMTNVVMLTTIAALIPPLTIWLSRQLVDLVAAAAIRPVSVTAWAPLAVGFGLAFAVQSTLQLIQINRAQHFAEQVAHTFDHRFLAYAGQADMAYLDDPEWHDRVTRAARSLTSRPVNLVHGLIQLASALLTSLGVLEVLFALHPLLVLLGLAQCCSASPINNIAHG
jgi:ATP-binding cassette subfamily B protein